MSRGHDYALTGVCYSLRTVISIPQWYVWLKPEVTAHARGQEQS